MATRRPAAKRTRRAKGAGSVYQRGDGQWVASATIDGRKVRRYDPTQVGAQLKLIELQGQAQRGAVPTTKGRTPAFGAFMATWLASREGRVSYKTYKRLQQQIRDHIAPGELGRLPVTRVEASHVTALLNRLAKQGLTPGTCRQVRSVIRAALSNAQRAGLVTRNAGADAEPPRLDHQEMQVLSLEETRALLALCEESDGREVNLYAFLVATGFRISEALGLRWGDWVEPHVLLRRQLQRRPGTFALDDLKTKGSVRDVHLADAAVAALERQRVRQAAQRLAAGRKWKGEEWGGLVFLTPDGLPLDAPAVTRRFHTFMLANGLPSVRIHDLRHTYATLALQNGVPVGDVSRSLGHSTVSQTLNTYWHGSGQSQAAMAQRLNQLFG